MPINTPHPEFLTYKEDAEFVETFYCGEKAVKAAGVKLLPKLSGQTNERYKSYKDRAVVFGVVQRTVQALVAVAFRKDPAIILPEQLQYMREDCTGTGVPLLSFAMRLLSHLLVGGRAGILVDMPREGGRPFLVLYDGDDLRNWNEDSGEEFVVLENSSLVRNQDDKFELTEVEGWRELCIENGEYVVRLWQSDEKGTPQIVETSQPLRFGRALDYIPFAPVSSFGVEYEVSTPPLLPLASIAHKMYMISADRFLACHLLAVPTPVIISDIDKDDFGTLELGADRALLLPAGSSATYLEFTGQGLTSLESAEEDLQNQAAALGAKMLLGAKGSTTEKAEGVRSRDLTSNSILVSVLTAMESALNKSLKWSAEWVGAKPDETQFKISKELLTTNMDANMVNALTSAYLQGALDLDTLYHNLNEGGFIAAETDKETFAANIKKQQDDLAKREAAAKPAPVQVEKPESDEETLDNAEKV